MRVLADGISYTGYPMLDIGDRILLRQLVPEQESWDKIEYEASVWAVKRAQATIILRCDALYDHRASMVFNVQFRPQGRVLALRFRLNL